MNEIIEFPEKLKPTRVISVLVFITLFAPYLVVFDNGRLGMISVFIGLSYNFNQGGFIISFPFLQPVSVILWAPNAIFSYIAYQSYLGESLFGKFLALLIFSLWYINLWGSFFSIVSINIHFPIPLLHLVGLYYYFEGRDRNVKHVW